MLEKAETELMSEFKKKNPKTEKQTSPAVELTCQEKEVKMSEQTERQTSQAIELEGAVGRQNVLGEQIIVFGLDGPEKTKNSFTEEKSGVREREYNPTYIEGASMNKSRVGERESRLTHTKVASMNKSVWGSEKIRRMSRQIDRQVQSESWLARITLPTAQPQHQAWEMARTQR